MRKTPTPRALIAQTRELQERIAQLRRANDELRTDVEVRNKEAEQLAQRLREEQDHGAVLAGDRDRLTACIESLARRLASPGAERLLARAGWRAGNLISGPADKAEKASDSTRTMYSRWTPRPINV